MGVKMNAKEVMTRKVVMVEDSVTVGDAVKKMMEEKVSSLIVNRRTVDDAYGIVTRRDIVSKVVAFGLNAEETKVEDVMTKPLVTVTPNLNIKHVARLMSQTGVRRIPVFDGQQMLGLISNSDIFRAFGKYLMAEESKETSML